MPTCMPLLIQEILNIQDFAIVAEMKHIQPYIYRFLMPHQTASSSSSLFTSSIGFEKRFCPGDEITSTNGYSQCDKTLDVLRNYLSVIVRGHAFACMHVQTRKYVDQPAHLHILVSVFQLYVAV